MKVGFIGLGNVGAKLSGSLLRNGVDLTIHDLDDARVADFVARGASRGNSPADLMEHCDIVITCLPSPIRNYFKRNRILCFYYFTRTKSRG